MNENPEIVVDPEIPPRPPLFFSLRPNPQFERVFVSLSSDGTLEIPGQVTIFPDGTVEFAEGYSPSAAAAAFWQAVAMMRPKDA